MGLATLLSVVMIPSSTLGQSSLQAVLDELKIPLWNETFDVRGSFGYKDNVLLSETNLLGSPFLAVGGDMVVFRLPTTGWLLNILASADYTRYFHGGSVDGEDALAAAQLTRDYGNQWSSGFGVNYMFQHQVLDLNSLATNGVGEVVGHTFSLRWFERKDLHRGWIEIDLGGTRQLLAAPLDGFAQFGPKLVVGRRFGTSSDLTLTCQYNHLLFDTREQVNRQGALLAGTLLGFDTQSVEAAWHHVWDEKKHWQTSLAAGFEVNQDNGSGYFDYQLFRVSPKIDYHAGAWNFSVQGRFGYYEYPVETVSPSSSSLLSRWYASPALHAERKLSKSLKVFADFVYDGSFANEEGLSYRSTTLSVGLDWRF